ncbi:MAG: transcriptional repressor, partial [Geminicoccales bacterium]
ALNRAAELCARRGARLTRLRRRVLELVWQDHSAVKAYDILDRLGDQAGSAKPPTVYRALDFLMAHGLVHRLESLNAFVGCPTPESSHQGQFLICDGCGAVREFEAPTIRSAIARQAGAYGFAVQQQTIEAHGTCRRCRETADA